MLEEDLEGSLELSIKMRKKLDENKWDQMTKKAEFTEKKNKEKEFVQGDLHPLPMVRGS